MSEYIQLPMKDGSLYTVQTLLIDHFQHELPEIDVEREFRFMALWLETHPTRRKTKRGIKAFIGTWLMKAVKDAPVSPKKVPEVVKDTRSSCFACFKYYDGPDVMAEIKLAGERCQVRACSEKCRNALIERFPPLRHS